MGQEHRQRCLKVFSYIFLVSFCFVSFGVESSELEPLTLQNPFLPSQNSLIQSSFFNFVEEIKLNTNQTFFVEETTEYFGIVGQTFNHSDECYHSTIKKTFTIEEICSYISLWVNAKELTLSPSTPFQDSFISILDFKINGLSSSPLTIPLSVAPSASSSDSHLMFRSLKEKAVAFDKEYSSDWLKVTLGVNQKRWVGLWVEDILLTSVVITDQQEIQPFYISLSLDPRCGENKHVQGDMEFKGVSISIPDMPLSLEDLESRTPRQQSLPVPVITSLDPSTGHPEGGTAVTIRGSGIVNTATLNCLFGDYLVQGLFLTGISRVVCLSPPMPAGKSQIEVRVTNDGSHFSNSLPYTYEIPPPVLTGVSPTTSINAGGISITVEGNNFVDDPRLTCFFGNIGYSSGTVVTYYGYGDRLVCPTIATSWIGNVWLRVSNDLVTTSNAIPFEYLSTPEAWIRGMEPWGGYSRGGTVVTIYGGNFVIGNNFFCRFDDQLVSPISWDSDRIYCPAPPGMVGDVSVSISNDNRTWSGELPFFYLGSESSLLMKNTSQTATVLGGSYLELSTIILGSTERVIYLGIQCLFDYSEATEAEVVSSNTTNVNLRCRVPPIWTSTPIDVDVTLLLDGEPIDSSIPLRIEPVPTPVISSIWPTVIPVQGGTSITIMASNVLSGDNIRCNFDEEGSNVYAAPIFINPDGLSLLQCNAPETLKFGQLPVTIDDGFTTSEPHTITVYVPTPSISNVYPTWGIVENLDPTVTIHGSNFLPDYLGCSWDGKTYTHGTLHMIQYQMNTTSTGNNSTTNGTATGTNTTTNGTATGTNTTTNGTATGKNTTTNGTATGTNTTTNGTATGTNTTTNGTATGTNTTTNGTATGTNSTMNGTTTVTDYYLTCPVPLLSPGDHTVYLTNNDTKVEFHYTFYDRSTYWAPTAYNVTPSWDYVIGGTTVTVMGYGFINSTYLRCLWNGYPQVKAVFVSNTTITCVSPKVSFYRLFNFSVSNNNSYYSPPIPFTYKPIPSPKIVSYYPPIANVFGGNELFVNATDIVPNPDLNCYFTPSTIVAATLIATSNVTVNKTSVTQYTLSCPIPATDAPKTVNVLLGNNKVNYSLPFNITYRVPAPIARYASPNHGPMVGGTKVLITGERFLPGSKLMCKFGTKLVNATIIPNRENTLITCVSPPVDVPGVVYLYVTNDNVSFSYPIEFTYYLNPPELVSIFPEHASVLGGALVTIYGKKFMPNYGLSCKFGVAEPVPGTIVQNDTNTGYGKVITCVAPRYLYLTDANLRVSNDGYYYSEPPMNFHYDMIVPKITSISPTDGLVFGGTEITITGENFFPLNFVCQFDDIMVSSGIVVDTNFTKAICVVPRLEEARVIETSINVNLTVLNNQTVSSNSKTFTYTPVPVPTLESMEPTTGLVYGGTLIVITGKGFVQSEYLTCQFGQGNDTFTVPGEVADFSNNTKVTCVSPPADRRGSVEVSVSNNDLDFSNSLNFTYLVPVPSITSVSPTSASILGGTIVTVTGKDFVSTSLGRCRFTDELTGQYKESVSTFVSAEMITCPVPATNKVGAVLLTVTNDGEKYSTNSLRFTYLQIPTPTLMSLTPTSTRISGGINITITGSNFLDLPLLRCDFGSLGQVEAIFVAGGTQVICEAPPAETALIINIRVTNDGKSFSNSLSFSYTIPKPVLHSAIPNTIDTNGGVNITIVGQDFLDISTLICNFGTTPAVSRVALYINETTIICVAPSSNFPEEISIRVTNDGIFYSNILPLTYVLPVPVISSLSPSSGPISGGTRVTVTGINFLQSKTLSCKFGDYGRVLGIVVAQTSLTQITCFAPPASKAGAIPVSVSNDAATYSNTLNYTYQ